MVVHRLMSRVTEPLAVGGGPDTVVLYGPSEAACERLAGALHEELAARGLSVETITTSEPWSLETDVVNPASAIAVFVPPPDRPARRSLAWEQMQRAGLELDELDQLVTITEGWGEDDIVRFVASAAKEDEVRIDGAGTWWIPTVDDWLGQARTLLCRWPSCATDDLGAYLQRSCLM